VNCECCSSRWATGVPPTGNQARYRWVFANSGNVVRLCERCCAEWRANAVETPELGPSRITQIAFLEGRNSPRCARFHGLAEINAGKR